MGIQKAFLLLVAAMLIIIAFDSLHKHTELQATQMQEGLTQNERVSKDPSDSSLRSDSFLERMREPEHLIDWGQLDLKVAQTEVVSVIKGFGLEQMGPKEGRKLVVVTLEGIADKEFNIIVRDNEFSAIYDRFPSAPSVATNYDLSSPFWSIKKAIGGVIGPGPVKIGIVFSLPEEVESFHVCYPKAARGKAIVSTTLKDTPQK